MGKKKDVSAAEKQQIVECLGQGMTTINVAKTLHRDHRTIKKYVADSEHTRVRADKGKLRTLYNQQLRQVKRAAAKMPFHSSRQVFEAAGASNVPRTTRCRVLQRFAAHFLPWFKKKNRAFRSKIIFMHDNAPSHAAKNTSASLAAMGIKGDKLMVWPPCSPDLNPIENLWSIIKRSVYDDGRQFTSKQQLWEGILSSCKTIEADTIQNLTNSMDERVQKLLSNKGSYMQM
ncbi:hypothetical protein MHYP_G00248740 [Metynnis hypsauchen]